MSKKIEKYRFTNGDEMVYNDTNEKSLNWSISNSIIRYLPRIYICKENDGIYVIHTKPKDKSSHTYQDRFFRSLYQDPKRALELCRACSSVDYPEKTKVEFYDLEKTLSKRFNEFTILLDNKQLFIIEHTSTISANFPLRIFLYIVDILVTWFIVVRELHKSTLFKIPEPKCYVLYTGKEPLRKTELRLSEAFKTDGDSNESFDLELTVPIIDVNHGSGSPILQKSKSLREYSYLIDHIKKGMDQGFSRDKAIKESIDHCIQTGVLEDFLKANYEEAAKMLNWEYDQEEEHEAIREEEQEKYEEKLMKYEEEFMKERMKHTEEKQDFIAKIRLLEEQLRLSQS